MVALTSTVDIRFLENVDCLLANLMIAAVVVQCLNSIGRDLIGVNLMVGWNLPLPYLSSMVMEWSTEL